MKSSNGFNKKQKEEIREIVKSEIREAFRKNAKPDINVKNEVTEAMYSMLNEKNDNLIKNLSEIEDKISQEETGKSLFTYGIKGLLYVSGVLACVFGVMFVVATIYFCFTTGYLKENILGVIQLFLIELILAIFLVLFLRSIKHMNKNDTYNSFMFIVTIIAFIITIFTTLK